MTDTNLAELLALVKSGALEIPDAERRIKDLSFEDIGFARVDHDRPARQGFPEVIFGAGKTREQTAAIFERLARRSPNVLVTRTDRDTFGDLRNIASEA